MTLQISSSFSKQINYDEVLKKLKREECVILICNVLGLVCYFHNCVKSEVTQILDPKKFLITCVDLKESPDLFHRWSELIIASGEKFCTCGLKEQIIETRWMSGKMAFIGAPS